MYKKKGRPPGRPKKAKQDAELKPKPSVEEKEKNEPEICKCGKT
jgi:hypothetical protein